MNPDGIHYLDMGDAYWRGDWHMAINAWWSPLYSWLLGLCLMALKPSADREFPVAHLVNLLVYVAAIGCFEAFLRAFVDDRGSSGRTIQEGDGVLPEWAWWTLGYSLFIWTTLKLIPMSLVTPDLCVAAFVYLAAALLLRARTGTAGWRPFVLLGAVLGFGYLTKTVMFPLALVILAVAMFSSGSPRRSLSRVSAAALVFLGIAAPFVGALSRSKGRLTVGESARVDYAVYVNGVDLFFPTGGTLKHPVRKVFEQPETYEYGTPIAGTYPIGYDNSYWHEGVEPRFDLRGEVGAITQAFLLYGWLFFGTFPQLAFGTGALLLYAGAPRPWVCLKTAAAGWPVVIPALAAFAFYALIVAESRFFGAFVCLLWMVVFSGARPAASRGSRRWVASVVIGIAVMTWGSMLWSTGHALLENGERGRKYAEAARALLEKGISPGDGIAVVGKVPFAEGGAYVARLARIRMVAETRRPESLWEADAPTRSRWIEVLRKTGAKAILMLGEPPGGVSDIPWDRLGNTEYYVSMLEN